MAGRWSLAGLLAYGNANDIVLELAREVLPVVKKVPVLAGINGTDPFTNWDMFPSRLKAEGFAGVQNFPTAGLVDGVFRANLEETGMGYGLEIEAIERASKMDLLTTPYVFSAEDAMAMAKAGAGILVAHMGLTTAGTIGAKTAKSLDESVALVDEITEAARSVRKDVIMLCHGGPIAQPPDAAYVLRKCRDIQGFYGASSMERLPAEVSIKARAARFCDIKFK
jgi:predicted TIM-barrel enzyme